MTQDAHTNIEERLDALEKREAEIELEEQKILAVDQHILEEVEKTRKDTRFARTLYRLRFAISILLTVGVALIWEGIGKITETLPLVSSAVGAIAVGLVILITIDLLTKNKK